MGLMFMTKEKNMGFKMKSKATKKAVKAATESGGGLKRFKWDDNRLSGELLILAPVNDDMGAVFTSKNHEYWVNGRPVSKAGTPSYSSKNGGEATGEEDKLVTLGWKLRDKYANSKNEKKKDFWRKCMLNTQHHCVVLDLKNIEAGPMVYTMPTSVSDVVLEEIKDTLAEEDDLTSICDFDEGRRLYIKTNGEKGKKRKYKIIKFKDAVNLIEDGALSEEDLEEMSKKVYDLSKLQMKYSDESFEKHYEFIVEKAKKLGIDIDDLDEAEEDDEEYEEEDNVEEEEDLGIDEEDLNLDEEEDEEEEEKPAPKKRASSRSSRTSARAAKKPSSRRGRRK
jgi:hypothetical protein